ncbi:MAG TPA: DUF72 domain-containing protein [Gemmatimonadales bacterium]|nr:DUF72 domain-containing protein [Gemmatimonadales bacterium]
MPRLLIGTSGYVYPHWRKGVFYPAGLSARRELEWYAERFPTVELNNPFYRLPEPATVKRWRDAVPPTFLFAVKASRFITHTLRLRDSGTSLAELQGRAALLGPKRGPVLFQLPPTFPLDLPRLVAFVAQLDPDWRWVMEFRHPSWHLAEVYDALARHAVALCIPIGGPVFPDLVVTAPFVYLRFHAGRAPGGGFEAEVLREWAGRLRGVLRAGLDAYVYFNNDRDGHAVRDARSLTALLQRDRSP